MSGKILGGHQVQIIGRSDDNGKLYRLVVKSWSTAWGNFVSGIFLKILRGLKNTLELKMQFMLVIQFKKTLYPFSYKYRFPKSKLLGIGFSMS